LLKDGFCDQFALLFELLLELAATEELNHTLRR